MLHEKLSGWYDINSKRALANECSTSVREKEIFFLAVFLFLYFLFFTRRQEVTKWLQDIRLDQNSPLISSLDPIYYLCFLGILYKIKNRKKSAKFQESTVRNEEKERCSGSFQHIFIFLFFLFYYFYSCFWCKKMNRKSLASLKDTRNLTAAGDLQTTFSHRRNLGSLVPAVSSNSLGTLLIIQRITVPSWV